MKPKKRLAIDHHLLARAEHCATGANAHAIHQLVAMYEALVALAEHEDVSARHERIERRLRATVAACTRDPFRSRGWLIPGASLC